MILSILIPVLAFACSVPRPSEESPSLADNFKKAAHVFVGTVLKQEEEKAFGGSVYTLKFEVEKSWKGSDAKKISFTAKSNTCNPFPADATVGSTCLVFLGPQNQLMAGVTAGEASTCFPPEAQTKKSMVQEFDARLRLMPK